MGTSKLLGCMMILFSSAGIGTFLGNKTGRRRNLLLLSAQMIGEIVSKLGFHLLPARELIEEIAGEERFSSLRYLQIFCQKKGQPFPKSWKQAVEEEKSELTPEDKELILRLGDVLGAFDLESQQAELTCLRRQIEQAAGFLEQQEEKEKKLYPVIGPLIGLAICILL